MIWGLRRLVEVGSVVCIDHEMGVRSFSRIDFSMADKLSRRSRMFIACIGPHVICDCAE